MSISHLPSQHAQVQFYLHFGIIVHGACKKKKLKLDTPCFFDEVDISEIFYLIHVW